MITPKIKRKIMLLIGILLVFFLLWIAYGYFSVRNIESPNYKVISIDGPFEIRDYDSYIVAQASISAKNYRQGINQGFRVVADYIFGNNTTQKPIAMTSPVVTGSSQSNISEKIAMTTPVVTRK